MTISRIICSVLLVASGAVNLTGQRIAAPARTQSQGQRLIGSLSPAERNQLPANTQVKLPSGQIVTLGALRGRHESHLRSIAMAANLGRLVADKLGRQPPVSVGTTRESLAPPPPHRFPATQVGNLRIEPFQQPSGVVPADYLAFCKAAQATVCLYLPADCDFQVSGNTAQCVDPFVADKNVCSRDGGQWVPYGAPDSIYAFACAFDFPLAQRKDFVPAGPATATVSCNLGTYHIDPRGSVQADAPASYTHTKAFTTPPGDPPVCVVQVRLPRAR